MSELRVTAYRYSLDRGLPCDLDSLAALGLAAAREGRWLGIPELKVPEGPELIVHTWPERVWDAALRLLRAGQGIMEIYAARKQAEWRDWAAGQPDTFAVTYRELTDAEEAAENATWD